MTPLIPPINFEQAMMQTARCRFLVALGEMQPHERAGSIRTAACGLINAREAEMLRAHYGIESVAPPFRF